MYVGMCLIKNNNEQGTGSFFKSVKSGHSMQIYKYLSTSPPNKCWFLVLNTGITLARLKVKTGSSWPHTLHPLASRHNPLASTSLKDSISQGYCPGLSPQPERQAAAPQAGLPEARCGVPPGLCQRQRLPAPPSVVSPQGWVASLR